MWWLQYYLVDPPPILPTYCRPAGRQFSGGVRAWPQRGEAAGKLERQTQDVVDAEAGMHICVRRWSTREDYTK